MTGVFLSPVDCKSWRNAMKQRGINFVMCFVLLFTVSKVLDAGGKLFVTHSQIGPHILTQPNPEHPSETYKAPSLASTSQKLRRLPALNPKTQILKPL